MTPQERQNLIEKMRDAGLDVTCKSSQPVLGIRMSDDDVVLPIGQEVVLVIGEEALALDLPPLSELFVGVKDPGEFGREPPEAYVTFFAIVEQTAFTCCRAQNRVETDLEFNRLYRRLRNFPDGSDRNLLFSYLQAAARVHMTLFEVSQKEFEAVIGRLAKSTKTFSRGPVSRNYLGQLREMFG